MLMNKIASNTQQETDLEDLVLTNTMILQEQISENAEDIETLDKTVSYSLTAHEESINTLDTLVSITSIKPTNNDILHLKNILIFTIRLHSDTICYKLRTGNVFLVREVVTEVYKHYIDHKS